MGGGSKSEHLLCTLPYPEPQELLDRVRKNNPHVKVTYIEIKNVVWDLKHDLPDDIWKDITVLCTLKTLPPSADVCPNLSLIHFISAGTNHIATHPIYTSTIIPLTTSSGIHGPPIAEWVLLTLLASTRAYNTLHAWQSAHTWPPSSDTNQRLGHVHNLVGARLGVLGYGSIGRQVARLGSALGMAVIAYTASPRPTPDSRRDRGFIVPGTGDPTGELPVEWFSGVGREPLHAFLAADLDVLVVSVPLTEATRGLLGADEFAILARRNAFVTNISRGGILDQDALIEALRAYVADGDGDTRRGLKGAALDVTSPEPLPRESPLWDAPNCIVTPHISGLGTEYLDRSLQVLEVNLERRERGVELINVVDRKKGY